MVPDPKQRSRELGTELTQLNWFFKPIPIKIWHFLVRVSSLSHNRSKTQNS